MSTTRDDPDAYDFDREDAILADCDRCGSKCLASYDKLCGKCWADDVTKERAEMHAAERGLKYIAMAIGRAVVTTPVLPSFREAQKQQHTSDLAMGCPKCGELAVVNLPPHELAKQKDGTTHVCHPALGGCNHGFEVSHAKT